MSEKKSNNSYTLIPFIGICLFIFLYFIAAFLYPGGSEINRLAKGFSWKYNYWCDLLATYSENGEPNTARPVAIIAMSVLCLSIAISWYFIPRLFTFNPYSKKIIQITGMMSMGMTVFLQADYHDSVINIAGILGVIAITGTLIGLYKIGSYKLLALGLLCLILCFLNTFIYYTKNLIWLLPIIQKISFFFFLFWFCLLTLQLHQKEKSTDKLSGRT